MNEDSPSLWGDWLNAEIYNSYVHEYPIYRELNRRLAEIAGLGDAKRVLDLACGSGATSRACLAFLGSDAELVGVDASEPLVELARMEIRDPRARFAVAPAAALERVVEGPFDRIVCNTAFWQFPSPTTVIRALGRLTEPGATFFFNVPAERVLGAAAAIHPFQAALARAIEDHTEGSFRKTPAQIDPDHLAEWLDDAGFDLERAERFVYNGRQEEFLELMKVPAMIGPLTPDLSPESRLAALRRAAERIDLEERVDVPWIYFIARRRAIR